MYFYSQFILSPQNQDLFKVHMLHLIFVILVFYILILLIYNNHMVSLLSLHSSFGFWEPRWLVESLSLILDLPGYFLLVSFPLFLCSLNSHKLDVRSRVWIRSTIHIYGWGCHVGGMSHCISLRSKSGPYISETEFDHLVKVVITILSHVNWQVGSDTLALFQNSLSLCKHSP